MFMEAAKGDTDISRKAWAMRKSIDDYQRWFTSMETCLKPVIACMHGAVVGGGECKLEVDGSNLDFSDRSHHGM